MLPAVVRAALREGARHDVLVVRGTRVLGVPGLLVGRALGRPVILQPEVNGEMSGEAFTWGWSRGRPLDPLVRRAAALRNRWLRDADAFVAMSRQIRDEMRGAGVAPERVSLIPHGVDTERFRPAGAGEREGLRGRLGLPDGLLAVFTGRLLRGKGLEALVAAVGELASALPELHVVLVGSGEGQALSVEERLRGQIGSRGLGDRFTLAGRVDAVEDYLRAADLFVFPSTFEGLGISLVEAAACGLPAVACRTGGMVDVVDEGRSGLLVAPGRVDELAGALRSLAADPGMRGRMGARARGVATERFDARESTRRYLSLFREVATSGVSVTSASRTPAAG
jgi:glycosyltransferase involved in cell wall biosynthesis